MSEESDRLVMEVSEVNEIDLVSLHKMIFVYNAVLSGWTVRKMDNDKFEFVKSLNEDVKREVNLSDYIRRFILFNLNLDNMNM